MWSLAVAATGVALMLLAVACSGEAKQPAAVTEPPMETPQRGGKIVYALESFPIGLDPTRGSWDASAHVVAYGLYDTLMYWDDDGEVKPNLAESMTPSSDFTVWTLRLRPGIKFHDGTPLNASAMKRLGDGHLQSALTSPATWPIASFEEVDDLTVRVVMSQPWATFPVLLAGQGGAVPAPSQLDDPSGTVKAVGTGPFVLESWAQNQRIVLKRNPSYWRSGLPYIDEIEFVSDPDVASRMAGLQRGDFDVTHTSSWEGLDQVRQGLETKELVALSDSFETDELFVMFNLDNPAVADVRLREAASLATDPVALAKKTGAPSAEPAVSPWLPTSRWFRSSTRPKTDIAKARSLIEALTAEGKNVRIKLSTLSAAWGQKMAQALAEQWAEAGIEVDVVGVEQKSFIVKAALGDYEAMTTRLFSSPDPDGNFHYWTSRNTRPVGQISLNFARLRSQDLDEALVRGRQSLDLGKRKAAYDDAQAEMDELVPYIWLFHTRWTAIAWSRVHDLGKFTFPSGEPGLSFNTGSHHLTETWVTRS